MSTSSSNHRIDRIVDTLIDRNHPFWQDERQAAVYNEAAAAALALQAILIIVVGGIGLLLVGRPAIGIVTAMVLTVTVGQVLIFGVLLRRHVAFDTKKWREQSSPTRRRVSLLLGVFYVACYVWARFHDTHFSKIDWSTIAGFATGIGFALALVALGAFASKRAIAKRQTHDGNE